MDRVYPAFHIELLFVLFEDGEFFLPVLMTAIAFPSPLFLTSGIRIFLELPLLLFFTAIPEGISTLISALDKEVDFPGLLLSAMRFDSTSVSRLKALKLITSNSFVFKMALLI